MEWNTARDWSYGYLPLAGMEASRLTAVTSFRQRFDCVDPVHTAGRPGKFHQPFTENSVVRKLELLILYAKEQMKSELNLRVNSHLIHFSHHFLKWRVAHA